MAIPVSAPKRKPRVGGIKDIIGGSFTEESRLSVVAGLTNLAWEDATCGTSLASLPAGCYVATGGIDEVQRLTITGAPTGGTFTLTFDGQTTAAIARNASATAVQNALLALSNVDPGDIVVTGGPGPATPYTFTFGGDLGDQDVPEMTVTASFTGGTTPAAAVTTITPGVPPAPLTGDETAQYTTIGDPFARYAGVQCFIGGDKDESFESQARRKFEGLEDRAVEAVLADWAGDAPSPGTATSIAAAVGVAEEHADMNYVGQPVLIMSRLAADLAFAARVLTRENGRLVSPNGTPVLASGVIVAGDEPDLIAIIGQPEVWATRVMTHQAPDLATNIDLAIAMRLFAIGVDCGYRYAVTVTAP